MQIQTIHVSHFLGCQAVDVRLHHRVHLFAGKNGAGKSSLRDSIALALTADLGRVSLKKEAAALIRDGSDLAVCEVITADRDEYRVSINRSGKITDSRIGKDADATLPYVLDAQRLARLTDTERRAFLFGLMGVKMGQAEIAERLKARGFEDARVQRVLPLLRSGFDAACKEAKAKATEAKGAWRTVTGEAYGSEKAKAWRAHVPAYDAGAAAQLATELQHCDVAAEQWQRQVGALEAEEKRRAGLRAKLPGLQEHAAKLGRIADKLAADVTSLNDWTADFEKTSAAAGTGPRVGLVHELARALTDLMAMTTPSDADAHTADWDRALNAMDAYTKEHGPVFSGTTSDPKAAARLPSVKHSRDLMASAVANDKRDLEAAKAAKTEADSITAELAETFDAAGLAEAKERGAALKQTRATIVQRQDALRSIKALVDAADAKTKGAAKHADDVAAWDALVDALAPDGIPAEILSEALGPINERLAQSAADTTWPTPVIGADMAITAGGREYRLLSESEKWRTDAMLAEAVASLSGVRLLVLDRFDVLDLQGRADALGWFDVLAETGEIDTALLFGMLKALPASLPETIGCSWIESGVCGQLQEAA
jgi:energy-coupling factor transporter ATP-binding protein EcfA2